MKILVILVSLIVLQRANSLAQEFIFHEPPQDIIDLKIGRADSFVIETSDPSDKGKYIAYGDLHCSVNEFCRLFNDTNQFVIFSFDIYDNRRKLIFSYMLPFINYARFVKINQTDYSIYEAFAFHFEKGFDSIKIDECLKYDMKITNNKIQIVLDTDFHKKKFKRDQNIQAFIDEYNLYKSQEAYTTKDWKKVSTESVDQLGKLAYNLTIASINGSSKCGSILMKFRDTFDIMNCGSLSEGLGHYELLLRKIKKEL